MSHLFSQRLNLMTRKALFASRLITLIGLMLLAHFAHSHDAFLPHHREDFDAMTRRQELQTTVLIITTGFIAVLAAVFYVASRGGRKENQEVYDTEQTRLERATKGAAQAAYAVLLDQGTPDETIRAALAAYAHASGVAWNQNSVVVSGEAIRCKIGSDVVVVKIFNPLGKCEIEVSASCDETNAKSVLEVSSAL